MGLPQVDNVRVCPQCGYSHLRPSRPRSPAERLRSSWTRMSWFRCDTCQWRGRLHDVWSPDAAFPDLKPMRLGRELNIEILQLRDEQAIVGMALARWADIGPTLRVWLDDSRPAPPGWLRLGTVGSVQRLLEAGLVQELSLDYDLGWCPDCVQQGEHLKQSDQRHCPHMPTGYNLVVWMTETGHWPALPPTVHSGNLDGGARMLGVIARHWRGDTLLGEPTEGEAPSDRMPASTTHGEMGSTAVATLTVCPNCHGPHLSRTHRRSNLERVRSLLTGRYPVRCVACGWAKWVHEPILVRFSSAAGPDAEIDASAFEDMQPDEHHGSGE